MSAIAGAATARRATSSGQASVELVGLLPLLIAAALGIAQLFAAGAARELAGHAAEAGAMAIVQGGDPAEAARAAVPGWSRDRVVVATVARTVRVRITPPTIFPGLAGSLTATARADAGPR